MKKILMFYLIACASSVMGQKKISEMDSVPSPTTDMYLPIVDPGEAQSSDRNKRITVWRFDQRYPQLTNQLNNRIITSSGGNILNGEANLTFDGSTWTLGSGLTAYSLTNAGAVISTGFAELWASVYTSNDWELSFNSAPLLTIEDAGDATFTGNITGFNADFLGTEAIRITRGLTGQRPGSPTPGDFRYNTSTNLFEGFNGSWLSFSGIQNLVDSGDSVINSGTGTGSFVWEQTSINGDTIILNTSSSSSNSAKILANNVGDSGSDPVMIFQSGESTINNRKLFEWRNNTTPVGEIDAGGGWYAYGPFQADGNISSVSGDLIIGGDGDFLGTEAVRISRGTTAQRPSTPIGGEARYNTDSSKFEGFEDGVWKDFITGALGGLSSQQVAYSDMNGDIIGSNNFSFESSQGILSVGGSDPNIKVGSTDRKSGITHTKALGSSGFHNMRASTAAGQDAGSTATFRITSDHNSAASLTTKPTLAGYNYLTKQWEVSANGAWDYQDNDLLNIDSLDANKITIGGVPVGTGTGDVTGPGSSTDNAIARFDGTTGKIIQNSTTTVDDSGNMNVGGNLTVEQSGSTMGIHLTGDLSAELLITEEDGTTDNKNWRFRAEAQEFRGMSANDANSSANDWVRVSRSGTSPTKINFPNGNVGIGIGTALAATKLEVGGGITAGAGSFTENCSITTGSLSRLTITAGTNNSASILLGNDAQIWDVNTQTIDNFAVFDQTNSKTPLKIEPNTASNTLYLHASGNIGIGNSSPATKLHVNGAITGDSVFADNILLDAVVELTPSQINNSSTTPIDLIPAPGAGQYIWVVRFTVSVDFNSAAYVTPSNPILRYSGGLSSTTAAATISNVITSGSDSAAGTFGAQSTGFGINESIQFYGGGSDPTTGDSNVKVHVWYMIGSI